ncbi:hypothetical protein HOLleu_27885 [Holothuria leucospilota]|uniref:Uncharacterized protein n=1 Tax=Holothuria leucospilota TaxID=206669 RepID=A0A9Q1BRA0_HOLLE|nr:hypothetical protein HOLleu_27885 [Holothuria leucospilota]
MSGNRPDQTVFEDQVNCDEDDGKLQLEIIWVRIVCFFSVLLSLAKGKVSGGGGGVRDFPVLYSTMQDSGFWLKFWFKIFSVRLSSLVLPGVGTLLIALCLLVVDRARIHLGV